MKKWMLAILFVWLANAAAVQAQLPDFTELAEKQGAAVVNISTTQVVRGQRFGQGFPFDENDPAFELFKRFGPRAFPNVPNLPREFENKSLGSGFIISTDGHILTNAHVIDGADEVVVKLADKRELKAKVIGADKRTDVALIKIDAANLPSVKLGDPARLRVGEWVVAIGSPFGFENTVTAGIVSAKGRSLPQENFVPFIQTDVAINPGNSGGPLFNMKGEVVGINSQIYSRSGGYQGIAFSIPIDVAMEIQTQLRANGKVSRGRIGVMIQEVTKELADSFGLDKPRGALVASVEKGGAAEKAGIESGDVILDFNGKPVVQSSDLPRIVGGSRPGSKAAVHIWRSGSTKEMSLTVGEMTDEGAGGKPRRSKQTDPAPANKLGLVLSEPTTDQKRQMGIRQGLIIEEVREGGRGELRQGDVIIAIIQRGSQIELRSIDQFNDLLSKQGKNALITLLVKRGDSQTFITLKGLGDK